MGAEAPKEPQPLRSNPETTTVTLPSNHKTAVWGQEWQIWTHLMAEKESFELSFGPVVHGVGQQLHGEGVHSQEVAHKDHFFYVLRK